MAIMSAQELKVYALGSRRIVYGPEGRGGGCAPAPRLARDRLGAYPPRSLRPAGAGAFADARIVQPVLDDWER